MQQAEALPGPSLDQWHRAAEEEEDGPVLTDEQKSRIQAMKPMTKEEWDARQSVIRKVVDPETGRTRLIKGDGEVLEEIVTKERHREINKVGVVLLPRPTPSSAAHVSPPVCSLPSKPPEGMVWPSRCGQGCCPEGPPARVFGQCW